MRPIYWGWPPADTIRGRTADNIGSEEVPSDGRQVGENRHARHLQAARPKHRSEPVQARVPRRSRHSHESNFPYEEAGARGAGRPSGEEGDGLAARCVEVEAHGY